MLELQDISVTSELLVKIEQVISHIQVQQLIVIKDATGMTYDELLQ